MIYIGNTRHIQNAIKIGYTTNLYNRMTCINTSYS